METTDEGVVDLVLEICSSLIIDAGPTPHILVIRVALGSLENAGCEGPHKDVEDEETNGEECVVDTGFLGTFVTSSPVGVENG